MYGGRRGGYRIGGGHISQSCDGSYIFITILNELVMPRHVSTGCSHYYAVNVLLKARRPILVQCLRSVIRMLLHQSCTAASFPQLEFALYQNYINGDTSIPVNFCTVTPLVLDFLHNRRAWFFATIVRTGRGCRNRKLPFEADMLCISHASLLSFVSVCWHHGNRSCLSLHFPRVF